MTNQPNNQTKPADPKNPARAEDCATDKKDGANETAKSETAKEEAANDKPAGKKDAA